MSLRKDLISKRKLITEIEEAFMVGFGRINKEVFSVVEKWIDNIERTKGKFDDNKARVLIRKMEVELRQVIKTGRMQTKVAAYLADFDKIEMANIRFHKKLNGLSNKQINPDRRFLSKVKKQTILEVTETMLASGVDAAFVEPIGAALRRNAILGADVNKTKKALESFVMGTPEKQGKLERYAHQISRDATNQYQGSMNKAIRDEFKFDAWRYVNPLVRKSRPQCKRWVAKKILKVSEIEKEIRWAESSGSGMIEPKGSTTKENFDVYRGGYNCEHEAIGFRFDDENAKKQLTEFD